ncbi:uncharacterized protein LOC129739774 [Uranotaenia lowii]|uniref:uncharacterized protein LOC129739774 n=1 Tax=Uranotaenia lowii TaxID=190385 RepID=UPI0024797198|nr:uncharacterized protein LOC129739774 [Uranotaenia lowii]
MSEKSYFLLVTLLVISRRVSTLNAVYVNNHKIDKYEVDKIKLLQPTDTNTIVTKLNLLTKDNFTNPLHYYQYLVGNDPGSYVDMLWGKNKTYLPSIFRSTSTTTTEVPVTTAVQFADDLSSIENTLNNTTPIYKGDYHLSQWDKLSTTTPRTLKQIKKPKTKPQPIQNQTKISVETLELLRKYFTINCTLTPLQDLSTTPIPKVVTKKAKKKHKTTTTPNPVTLTNKLVKPSKIKKPYRPVVYVEPPVISGLGGMLETVYNYMQDAFVSTEYISVEEADDDRNRKTKKGKKTKRNSVPNVNTTINAVTTVSPFTSKNYPLSSKQVSIGGQDLTNKNKLTTNIHVTSEYTPATPATLPFLPQLAIGDKDGSSEESESEEGGDYYGGFANNSYEDDEGSDEDEAEEDSVEDDGSDEYAEGVSGEVTNGLNVVHKVEDYGDHSVPSTKVKRQKPVAASDEDYSTEDDDDYDSDEESASSDPGFFSGMMASLGRFVRSFGFPGGTAVEYDDYDESRSTTPRAIDFRRRPTRSTNNRVSTQIERVQQPTEKQDPWLYYPSYLFNELSEDTIVPTQPSFPAAVDENETGDWFQYMMPWNFFNPWSSTWDSQPSSLSTSNQVESTPPTLAATSASSGWFSDMFESATTEAPQNSAQKPLIPFLPASDPLQKPQTWISVLAHHILTTTRPPKLTTASSSSSLASKPTKEHYSDYQLWRVYPKTLEQVRHLEDYRYSPEGIKLQWWKGPTLKGSNDILVPPKMLETVADYLQEASIDKDIMIRNLGQAIQYENPKMTRREQIENEVLNGHPLTWYRYHRYGDIVKFMSYLGRKYPKNVDLVHIGRSFEGRPLTVVKISFDKVRTKGGVKNTKNRKHVIKKRGQKGAVFIEAGAHGREWIGPSVATWILDMLAKASSSNDTELENIKSMDWYILPVLNPDGYEYSHDYDRMWRKTRSKHPDTESTGIINSALNWLNLQSTLTVDSDQQCYGTDLNRNWDHHWNAEGASKSTCSEYYSGYKAFSEPETLALSKFLTSDRRNVKIYLSLHSYGQSISYPEEKRSTEEARYSDVHEMAAVAVEALRGSGSHTVYKVDAENEMMYPRSGTSVQFARYEAGIKYSYTVELPDLGTHGFLMPPSGIIRTAQDVFEILKGMVDFI